VRVPRIPLAGATAGALVDLPAAEARHLVRVLRLKTGDEVIVVAADGRAYRATLETLAAPGSAVGARVRVGEAAAVPAPTIVPWTVAVALVKSGDMDLAVRLASEVGLARLIPLASERAEVKAERSGRPRRWARLAHESAKQCGRLRPLEIAEPSNLARVLEAARGDRGEKSLWIAVPGAPAAWEGLRGPGGPATALFLVGPEGGFSPAEVERARAAGARAIGFPTPVLRTPTALMFIACLGALLCEEGEPPGAPA
jgi:16S rRNA (uracil1498-N3)-methyltransferase